jgi:hypothetical protein
MSVAYSEERGHITIIDSVGVPAHTIFGLYRMLASIKSSGWM